MEVNYYLITASLFISALLCKDMFASAYRGCREANDDFRKSTDYINPITKKSFLGVSKVGESQRPLTVLAFLAPVVPMLVLASIIYFSCLGVWHFLNV